MALVIKQLKNDVIGKQKSTVNLTHQWTLNHELASGAKLAEGGYLEPSSLKN